MVDVGVGATPTTREDLKTWLASVCGQDLQMQQKTLENLILNARSGKKFKITEPKQDGGWYEFNLAPDENGKRRKIRKHSRLEVLKEIYMYYYGEEYSEKKRVTFDSMWKEWTQYRESQLETETEGGLNPLTLYRQETDYTKYFGDSCLKDTSLSKITTAMLNDELLAIIKRTGMTSKALTTVLGYLRDLFERAIDAGYITQNPETRVNRAMLRRHCQEKKTHDDEERILNDIEIYKILDVVRKDEREHPQKAINYAIELAMQTGLRVGELSALRYSDIVDGMLCVTKSEHEKRVRGEKYAYYLGDTKNRKHRRVPLSDAAMDIIERLRLATDGKDDVFLFRDEKTGKRKTAKSIGSAATRRGNAAGIAHTSIHRIRRTVVSKLVTEGTPLNIVADWMGHTIEVSAENYIYNQWSKEQQEEQFNRSLHYEKPKLEVI